MATTHHTAAGRPLFVWPTARAVVLCAAVGIFVALCVLPVIYMLVVSFSNADGGFSLDHYRRLLAEPRQRELLLASALLGGGAAALATVIGAPLGLLLARVELRGKRLLRLALVSPLVIPPYILALAWIYLGGPVGLIAQALGRDLLSGWT